MTIASNESLYWTRLQADRAFSVELERQFGKKAVEMRYAWPHTAYDERTRAAYEEFQRVHEIPWF